MTLVVLFTLTIKVLHLGLKLSERIFLMTCFNGHSSSLYRVAIRAFFSSHTSDGMETEFFIFERLCSAWTIEKG